MYNSYLRIIVKDLPEDTIGLISAWLQNRNWNLHPRNGRDDLVAQHYDPDPVLLDETRDQLHTMNIAAYEMDV